MNKLELRLNRWLLSSNGGLVEVISNIESAASNHEAQIALHSYEKSLCEDLVELAKAKLKEQQRIQDLDKKIIEVEKKKYDDFNALIESLPEGEQREEPTIEEQEQILWGQHQEEVEFHNNNNDQ